MVHLAKSDQTHVSILQQDSHGMVGLHKSDLPQTQPAERAKDFPDV